MTDSTKPDLKQVTAPRRMPMDPALSEEWSEYSRQRTYATPGVK
jgi:hypothetical protein